LSRPHIVIADDEPRFRETIAKILERKGFVVTAVETGIQVLELLQTVSPQVILLDVRMPDLGGDEALPRILAMKPRCRVIILTGHGDLASARKAQATGAFDYLCKPCDTDILVERIIDAVNAPRFEGVRERTVTEIMIPIEDYTCIQASSTVGEGIKQLRIASENFISSGLIMDSGHRAVLVFEGDELVGVLAMRNLIQAVRPDFLSSGHDGAARCTQFSPLFWSGLFTIRVHTLESRCVREIMNPRPPVVGCDVSLTEVAHLLCEENRRRVAVQRDGRIIGVVREQELFREISRLILDQK
jgi:CheY-like chemotaxis protein